MVEKPATKKPECVAAVEVIRHDGNLVALSRHLHGRLDRQPTIPTVYFVGRRTFTVATLRGPREAWGPQLESYLPEQPLLGLGFAEYLKDETFDGLAATPFTGNALWLMDHHSEMSAFHPDNGDDPCLPPDLHLDTSFLDWHQAKVSCHGRA